MRCRHAMRRSDCHPTRATWGARCGKSARRVLRGGTGTSDLVARPVPTHHAGDGYGFHAALFCDFGAGLSYGGLVIHDKYVHGGRLTLNCRFVTHCIKPEDFIMELVA